MSQASPKHHHGAGTTAVAKMLAVGAEPPLAARPIPSVSSIWPKSLFFPPSFIFQGRFWAESIPEPPQGMDGVGAWGRSVVWDGGAERTRHRPSRMQIWGFFSLKTTTSEATGHLWGFVSLPTAPRPYRDISESPSFPSPFMSNIRSCRTQAAPGHPLPPRHPKRGAAMAPGSPPPPVGPGWGCPPCSGCHLRWSACTPAAWARRTAGLLSSAGRTKSPVGTGTAPSRWLSPSSDNGDVPAPAPRSQPTLSSLASM